MKKMTRRKFLLYGAGAAALGALGYACLFEPHFVEIVRRSLPVEHLPEKLRGSTLALISDLHVGPRVDSDYLIDSIRRIGPMNPDIVAITGDIIHFRNPERFVMLQRVLKELPHGKRATVAVLGNHDYGHKWSEPDVAELVVAECNAAGVTVLRNETLDVDGLLLIGMDDFLANRFKPQEALAQWNPERAALVLCHNPDALDLPGWGNYSGWVLSGHTHGGQCKPPFLPAPILPVRNRLYSSGEISLPDGRRVYINRGLGYLHRVRFNVRPEITVFTLA